MEEHQETPLTTLCMAPSPLSSASVGRFPAGSFVVVSTPPHLRLGLPLDAVWTRYDFDGRSMPACVFPRDDRHLPSNAGLMAERLSRPCSHRSAPGTSGQPPLGRSPCSPGCHGRPRIPSLEGTASPLAAASSEARRPPTRRCQQTVRREFLTEASDPSRDEDNRFQTPTLAGALAAVCSLLCRTARFLCPSHDGPPPEGSATPPDESGGWASSLIASCPCVPRPLPRSRGKLPQPTTGPFSIDESVVTSSVSLRGHSLLPWVFFPSKTR